MSTLARGWLVRRRRGGEEEEEGGEGLALLLERLEDAEERLEGRLDGDMVLTTVGRDKSKVKEEVEQAANGKYRSAKSTLMLF